jgi:putative hydrolase of the HAD superfamily
MDIISSADLTAFRRVETLIFDLYNTLYPAECNLFAQVDQRMGAFISELLGVNREEAKRIQKDYYYRYGTTLAGLMREHKLPPERFLDYVHDIDLAPVAESPALGAALERLPGKKYIFTNGSRRHAERVAGKLGVLHHFDDLFDIAACDYVPKPSAAMFEDLPHNLESPHALGMATVLVRSSYIDHPTQRAMTEWRTLPAHIHHMTDNLTGFLEDVLAATAPEANPEQSV